MIIAILLVVVLLALALIVGLAVSRVLQPSSGALEGQIEPIDVAAFRNLVDPAEDEYLRLHLSPAQFRVTQRSRLRARAAYVWAARRNANVLIDVGQTALATEDARLQEAARRLVNDALFLRSNTTVALRRIYAAWAWPKGSTPTAGLIDGYERLSSSAMLLGRLRNPAVPVRVTAGSR